MPKFLPIGEGSARTLYRQRKRLGLIKSRDYKINTVQNEDFFFTWSDELAWVLGLIWTDGHISGNIVSICSKDLEMLEQVAALTKNSEPPKKRRGKNAWDIFMNSKRVCAHLRSMGLDGSKTFTATFPDMPTEYRAAFVRGLIDGDGSIVLNKKCYTTPRIRVFICGASLLHEGICNWLTEMGIHNSMEWKESRVWKVRVWRVQDLEKLHGLLYPSNEVSCLKRKRAVYDQWLNGYWVKSKEYHSLSRNPKCLYCGGETKGRTIKPCKIDPQRCSYRCKSCQKYSYFYSQAGQMCLDLGI